MKCIDSFGSPPVLATHLLIQQPYSIRVYGFKLKWFHINLKPTVKQYIILYVDYKNMGNNQNKLTR